MVQTFDRKVELIGILFCVLCLAYFYIVDRIVFSSADFSVIFRSLLLIYDIKVAWLAVATCFLAAIWNRPIPVLRLIDFLSTRPVLVWFLTTAILSFGTNVIYHNYPLCMDEYAAVFQARIFAAGHIFTTFPLTVINWLVLPGFNGSFLVVSPDSGRAIEGYWPGFALLLAPFVLFGIPWACNATLSGLAVFLIFRITLDISGSRRAAGWAVLFTLASGAFLANGISYYSMQAHLTANLLFVALLLNPSSKRAFIAGCIGALALILHNPFPHVLFAIPWVVALMRNRDRHRYLLPLFLGYLPGLIIGYAWLLLRMDISTIAGDTSSVTKALNGVFVWPDAVLLDMRAASIAKMWVWATPCLFLFAFVGFWQNRNNRHVSLLGQSALLTFAAYLFVKLDQGHGWGYRYFHSAWGVIPILAGCAMVNKERINLRFISFAGASAVLSLLVIVPTQMYQIQGFIARHLAQVATPRKPGNNVYFIQAAGGFYTADMIQIDPFLRDEDLILASRGKQLDDILIKQNFPGAVEIRDGFFVAHWYLGPIDQRHSLPGDANSKQFKLFFSSQLGTSGNSQR